MHTFQTPNPIHLRLEIPKGRIHLSAEACDVTTVELVAIDGDETARRWIEEAQIEQDGDDIIVRVKEHDRGLFGREGAIEAKVRLPLQSDTRLLTGSGRIETTGALGEVEATSGSGAIRLGETAQARARTGSGDIEIARAATVDAKSGSGDVKLGQVEGDARVATGSGDADIGEYDGAARVHTASGKLTIGKVGDSLDAFSASGDIEVRAANHGRIRAKTVSGRVRVGVAGGAAAWLDVSTMTGRVESALEETPAPGETDRRVELVITTVSGNVSLARA